MNTNPTPATRRPRKARGRILMLLRRIHLYIGLFLLPWVFLYGITGAMLNHNGLLPEMGIAPVPADQLTDTAWANLPSQTEMAQQVVDAIQQASPDAKIELDTSHTPQYSNELVLQFNGSGAKHAVHFDPGDKSAWVATHYKTSEPLEPLLRDVKNIDITPDPFQLAQQSASAVLERAGITASGKPEPLGWTKLNFLASVDGEPVRVTYVLRDGHVDITRFTGDDGYSPRAFFVRLHTSHGQPPHWNGRRFWSLFIDAMAIAMVTWGVTGLLMWWQIKRTRRVGGIVILLSATTAAVMYYSMMHFYATNQL
ncbi:hypothetical protein K227x_02320 [Rubripirellula lacrimiformis]|uniref:PepSY-associated TM helix n=1 Tax=Rubripirellula lacrimiformis TaxID=1930273 RepID=A0A517N3Z9_9BACT|nr:PepSY domain-containing protein [Rubripirellula lacrimiformis]QDT01863.1 hypothetical protein K227x_02320 [Rubripirellula lacrimiformis]